MDFEFVRIQRGECVLCGSTGSLTGEHKIKASLIRAEFKDRKTVMAGMGKPRLAQSPKSKTYQFKSRICELCNSSRTQVGDRAFDKLHRCLSDLHEKGSELTDQTHKPKCSLDANVQVDYFRYFSKILCCFLAEVGGPRSKTLSAFALGHQNSIPIYLNISKDEEYYSKLISFNSQGFAEHGGLKFLLDDSMQLVQSFASSLSIGGIRYEFWAQLSPLSQMELSMNFPELVEKARKNIE